MSDRIDDALLDCALSLPRLTLEVDTSEVQQHLGFLLDDLALSDRRSEVFHEHVEDLLDCAVGEKSLELVRVEGLLNEVQRGLVDVSLLTRVQHVQQKRCLGLLI